MDRNPIFTSVYRDEMIINTDRHVLCPHYDKCLDDAVRVNRTFDCCECIYKRLDIKQYIIHDPNPG